MVVTYVTDLFYYIQMILLQNLKTVNQYSYVMLSNFEIQKCGQHYAHTV